MAWVCLLIIYLRSKQNKAFLRLHMVQIACWLWLILQVGIKKQGIFGLLNKKRTTVRLYPIRNNIG